MTAEPRTIAELEARILALRTEALASAVVGDMLSAAEAHEEARRLAALRDAALQREIVISEK